MPFQDCPVPKKRPCLRPGSLPAASPVLAPGRAGGFGLRVSLLTLGLAALLGGCLHVKIDPMEVNARVQMDVTLRADRVIEEYLGELNRQRQELLEKGR